MANFFEDVFGGGDIPKPGLVNLDPGTTDLMNNAYTRSAQSSGDLAKETFNPAAKLAQTSFGNTDAAQQAEIQHGGLMDPNMVSAIRSKQGRMLGQNLTNLSQQTSMNAFQQRAERLKFAQNAMIARQKIENSNYERLVAAANNENEIRAGVLKGWMSAVGTIVGGVYGGPVGAAAANRAVDAAVPGGKPQQINFGEDVTMPTGGRMYSGGTTQNDFLNGNAMGNYGSNSGSGGRY